MPYVCKMCGNTQAGFSADCICASPICRMKVAMLEPKTGTRTTRIVLDASMPEEVQRKLLDLVVLMREQEREAIVRWLRSPGGNGPETPAEALDLAERIEAGEHLGVK